MKKHNFYGPAEVASIFSESGVDKVKRGAADLLVLGILAGAYIAVAGLVSLVIGHDLVQHMGVGAARLIIGSVFTLGLALVVLAGAELFTGNCLLSVPLLDGRITWRGLLYNWAIVYFANFGGGLLIAALADAATVGSMNGGLLGSYAADVAVGKVSMSFSVAVSWPTGWSAWQCGLPLGPKTSPARYSASSCRSWALWLSIWNIRWLTCSLCPTG
jgi:formate/nitrite transporter FocA (FNT family)